MTAAERNARRGGRARLHRHPFVERQGLVHSRELVEPIRTQGANSQAQIDLGMRSNTGGHSSDFSLQGVRALLSGNTSSNSLLPITSPGEETLSRCIPSPRESSKSA